MGPSRYWFILEERADWEIVAKVVRNEVTLGESITTFPFLVIRSERGSGGVSCILSVSAVRIESTDSLLITDLGICNSFFCTLLLYTTI